MEPCVIQFSFNIPLSGVKDIFGISVYAMIQRISVMVAHRIDEIVIFDNLGKPQIKGIAALQLDQLRTRLENLNLSLNLSDEAIDLIVERGYDPAFGARPLKRTVQQLIENPLSQKILAGNYSSGSVIEAKVVNNEIAFSGI